MFRLAAAVALGALLWTLTTPSQAQEDTIWRAGARVNVVAHEQKAVWAAGSIVAARGRVREDVWAAGAEVEVDATAGRDLWAAGAIVTINGAAERDIGAAGARVAVNARAGRALRAAGARVRIGPQTEVGGPILLSGADVLFAGSSKGPAEIYGDEVRIDGRIAGDVRVLGRHVSVGPNAVIEGNVRFETFNEPAIEEGAKITGSQTVTLPQPQRAPPETWFAGVAVGTVFAVGAGFLLGLILLIGARGFVERSVDAVRRAPGRSILVGLAVLILLPIVAILLMVTIIGIPIGLLTLFAMPLLLFVASVVAAIALGDLLFNRGGGAVSFGGRLLYLLVGLLILVLIGMVPFLGFLSWLAAVLIGLGAVWRAMRAGRAGVAPAAA